MKKILILFLAWMGSAAYSACTVVDDAGQTIHLSQPAKRIISLSPDLTEDLFRIGAGASIVGVMQGSDYPEAAKHIPIVANYHSIDIEALLLTQPDLIVTWSEGVNLSPLTPWKIPIYKSHPKQLTDIAKTMQRLGCLVGEPGRADQEAQRFLQRYHMLVTQFQTKTPVDVFYQVWSAPWITVSKKSWIDEAIRVCGGKNIFAELKGVAPEVTIESVLSKNPAIIVSGMERKGWQAPWLSWPHLKAVKNQAFLSIHADWIERPGPRVLDGVSELCAAMNHRGKHVTDEG